MAVPAVLRPVVGADAVCRADDPCALPPEDVLLWTRHWNPGAAEEELRGRAFMVPHLPGTGRRAALEEGVLPASVPSASIVVRVERGCDAGPDAACMAGLTVAGAG